MTSERTLLAIVAALTLILAFAAELFASDILHQTISRKWSFEGALDFLLLEVLWNLLYLVPFLIGGIVIGCIASRGTLAFGFTFVLGLIGGLLLWQVVPKFLVSPETVDVRREFVYVAYFLPLVLCLLGGLSGHWVRRPDGATEV